MKVISGVYPGVTTTELDTLAAETAAALTIKHPDYAILGARIAVSNLHKETKKDFSGSYTLPSYLPSPFPARHVRPLAGHCRRAYVRGGGGGGGGGSVPISPIPAGGPYPNLRRRAAI